MQSARGGKGGAEREVLTLLTRRLQYSRPSRENCGHWVRWVLLPPSLGDRITGIAPPLVVFKNVGEVPSLAQRAARASAPPNDHTRITGSNFHPTILVPIDHHHPSARCAPKLASVRTTERRPLADLLWHTAAEGNAVPGSSTHAHERRAEAVGGGAEH